MINKTPGYFRITLTPDVGHCITYNCPCGCGVEHILAIRRQGEVYRDPDWIWYEDENDLTHPTLGPSVRHVSSCLFHGSLVHGTWTAYPDGPPLASNVFQSAVYTSIKCVCGYVTTSQHVVCLNCGAKL